MPFTIAVYEDFIISTIVDFMNCLIFFNESMRTS